MVSLSEFDFAIMNDSRAPVPLIGVDEAGRGPLAGPVTAAAAYIPPAVYPLLNEVNDSKKLTEKKRMALLALMRGSGVRFGFGFATPEEIDRLNILNATFHAMRMAVERLARELEAGDVLVLVDGPHKIKALSHRQEAVVDGDARSLAIAAASIFAKVTRDRWMAELDRLYPGYGFNAHKGYGTAAHMAALVQKGPSPVHRVSFAPVKQAMRARPAA